jgi:hypothetical protein
LHFLMHPSPEKYTQLPSVHSLVILIQSNTKRLSSALVGLTTPMFQRILARTCTLSISYFRSHTRSQLRLCPSGVSALFLG